MKESQGDFFVFGSKARLFSGEAVLAVVCSFAHIEQESQFHYSSFRSRIVNQPDESRLANSGGVKRRFAELFQVRFSEPDLLAVSLAFDSSPFATC